jgi:hypothetical protein
LSSQFLYICSIESAMIDAKTFITIQQRGQPIGRDDTIRFMDRTTAQNNISVKDYIASLDDEQTVKDCHELIEIMKRISGHESKIWNVGTIGFDTYHYKYDSGREGDAQVISFYPRKDKMTVYLMGGTVRHSELLARLGKHTTSRVCV